MATFKELSEQREKLVDNVKDLLAKPQSEGRDAMSAEESESYAKYKADIDALDKQRKAAYDYETAKSEAEGFGEDSLQLPDPKPKAQPARRTEEGFTLRDWFLSPVSGKPMPRVLELGAVGPAYRTPRNRKEAIKAHEELRNRRLESRGTADQIVGTDTEGGHLVLHEIKMGIEVALASYGGMFEVSRRVNTETGVTLSYPTIDDTGVSATVVSEASSIAVSDMTFAEKTIDVHKYSSGVQQVSVELMQDSSTDIPTLISELIGPRFARGVNAHLTTGTGSGQPYGVVTDATDSTVTLTTANTYTYAHLIDLKHSVNSEYRRSPQAAFMCNDTQLGYLKQIQDDQSRPIWLPSLMPGVDPDLFDGHPVVINADIAGAGSSAKTLIFGDFNQYVIREVGPSFSLVRLDELYAATGHVGFVALQRFGGRLLNTAAVKWADQPV
jgi:HK97 family phage major capsid protein